MHGIADDLGAPSPVPPVAAAFRPGDQRDRPALTTLTAKYADVYHLRDGKITEHWHLAVNPKAEEEFFTS